MNDLNYIRPAILGAVVADALGVPAEFRSREELKADPITDMVGYGTHYQPPGTWSDDSSLLLATADSLSRGFDLEDMMSRFRAWYEDKEYTPFGKVFDCGGATSAALERYGSGIPAAFCGCYDERDNGNGSLMRILPVSIFICETHNNMHWNGRWEPAAKISAASALTHAHPISMVGCGIYTEFVGALLQSKQKGDPLIQKLMDAIDQVESDYTHRGCGNIFHEERFASAFKEYARLKDVEAFAALPESKIKSGGYVVSTLEAALWCFLNTSSYKECVLKAVNLGKDTDTTACVAGGLAGIWYGIEQIPEDWIKALPKLDMIEDIIQRFTKRVEKEANR